MGDEGFDEWDDHFIKLLDIAEEKALSIATQKSIQPPPPLPPQPHPAVSYVGDSYSPPRELSQRVPDSSKGFNQLSDVDNFSVAVGLSTLPARGSHTTKEHEIDNLKRELERISEQRTRLEQECIELRKGRDKKEKGLKLAAPKIVNFNTDSGINIQGDQIKSLECQNTHSINDHISSSTKVGTVSSKDVGIQTEHDESISLSAESNLSDIFCRRNKLLDAWNSSNGQRLGRILISKLYATCEVDFRVLSGYLHMSLPLRTSMESNISLKDNLQYTHSD
ncbi:hypothetical protein K7X08_020899 [Anisodus acutangulus]|uniref:Uncharacterized protein n=1 Tax=Anisodus acutangulus TaxID=402998 RepID=A0A9Q1MTF5_9SOLA|nr:hypothetical protein K7X08_020899 [Anisodus acutangulus]